MTAGQSGALFCPSWFGPNKIVIRSAYGIFYNPIEQSVLLQFNGDPPYGRSSFVAAPGFANPFTDQTGFTNPSPFPFVPPNLGDLVNFNSFYPIFQFGNLPPKVPRLNKLCNSSCPEVEVNSSNHHENLLLRG